MRSMVKVKAHVVASDDQSELQRFLAVGNDAADREAKSALRRHPAESQAADVAWHLTWSDACEVMEVIGLGSALARREARRRAAFNVQRAGVGRHGCAGS